jgi:hypothetical protein
MNHPANHPFLERANQLQSESSQLTLEAKKLLLLIEKNPHSPQYWNRFRVRDAVDGTLPTFEDVLADVPEGFSLAKVTVTVELAATVSLDWKPYSSYSLED